MMRSRGFVLLIPAVVLVGAGCATKAYVREVVGQSQAMLDARIGEQGKRVEDQARRVTEHASRADAQGKQIEEMGGQVTRLETSVDEFGNIARTAVTKADEAQARAEEVNSRLSRFIANQHRRKLVETIHVHFGFDRAELTDAAQTALAELIKELAENPALVVDLQGYTDSRGAVEHNLQLSARRVESVRRFLVERGVDLPRINWIGMGEAGAESSKADMAKNRRVTVRMMLPEDATTARQESPQASTQ